MQPNEFVNFLYGYFELTKIKSVGKEETKIIKEKLQSVFNKVTIKNRAMEVNNQDNKTEMCNKNKLEKDKTPTNEYLNSEVLHNKVYFC